MTTTKKPRKTKLKTSFQTPADAPNEALSALNMAESLRKNMDVQPSLNKSVKSHTIKRDIQKKYDRSKIAFSSKDFAAFNGTEVKDARRISDIEQKELAQVDPYISAIITTRCGQGSVIGRPSDSKFDKGTRVLELSPLLADDFDTPEHFKMAQSHRSRHIESILSWFTTCGTTNKDVLNGSFAGMDSTFKQCSLPEFLSAQIRNLLTFGRCGTQIFRNEDGVPAFFRPVPIETIYFQDLSQDVHVSNREETSEQSITDADAINAIEDEADKPVTYVQRIDGHNVNVFTEDDLKISHFQKQALFDLNGYMLSPIEQAIYMVFVHQQTLNYLRNQFIKGIASKGILTLKSTDPTAQLSDEDLNSLRVDFHNFVSRNDNSAALPIIAGPIDVGFVQLNQSPNDMGFLQIEEHVIRALCSAFAISPQEMGYGHLSIGQGGLSQANKQQEITQGEERGLRQLLDVIFDLLNEILYENFPEAKDNFRLSYTGVGEDTRDSVVGRQQQELQTTATMSSLYADSEKTDTVPFGGNVPLAPLFHQNVVRYMKYGEFREYFLGDEDASKNPAYDFIIDPGMQQSYAQLQATPVKIQQEQTQLQMEQMQGQNQMMEQQAQQADQQGQMQQQVAQGGGQAPEQDQGQPEEAEKSLRDEYSSRQKLQKSVTSYFRDWMSAHE
jgi:hypothetical protein